MPQGVRNMNSPRPYRPPRRNDSVITPLPSAHDNAIASESCKGIDASLLSSSLLGISTKLALSGAETAPVTELTGELLRLANQSGGASKDAHLAKILRRTAKQANRKWQGTMRLPIASWFTIWRKFMLPTTC